MKIEIFDVVKLKNDDKAIIKEINNNTYKVDVTDKEGIAIGIKEIDKNDIIDVIYSKRDIK